MQQDECSETWRDGNWHDNAGSEPPEPVPSGVGTF